MKEGDRVVVASRGAIVRCRVELHRTVYNAGHEILREFSADYVPILLKPETEGILWARGWKTKAANALRVACAL